MKIGKLDNDLLKRIIINKIKYRRPEVKCSAAVGEDCAVIDFGGYNCVLSTDPITGAVNDIGRLAVHVSCNDIASNGVEPMGLLMTVLLPVNITEAEISGIMSDAAEAAAQLKVEILGGHTEITPAVTVPVICSTAVGRQTASAAVDRKAMPGDHIFMTKAAGIEGTGIIASDHSRLLREFLTEEEIAEALSYLDEISVVKEGVAAGKAGAGPMHDVTEGGILGAVWEICHLSGTGAQLDMDKIPVRPVTERICQRLGLDPYRLISSGCMLIVVGNDRKNRLERELRAAGVDYSVIGRITEKDKGMEILPPSADELFKVVHRERVDEDLGERGSEDEQK